VCPARQLFKSGRTHAPSVLQKQDQDGGSGFLVLLQEHQEFDGNLQLWYKPALIFTRKSKEERKNTREITTGVLRVL